VLARLVIPTALRLPALLLAFALTLSGGVAGGTAAGPVGELCGVLARQAERAQGIPTGLVHAVALAESGRWLADEGTTRPWPWTVTSGDDSFYLPSRSEALRKIEELQSEGRSNIDVGCMQVNLGYHGHEFTSVAEALEPASNVAYAARFLKRLHEETQSWTRATARYHSGDPARGQAYREKVFRWWDELLLRPTLERRSIRLAGSSEAASPGTLAPEPMERARLIVPGRTGAGRRAAPGAIPILRGN
jgi:Transglycosylase SLT domain